MSFAPNTPLLLESVLASDAARNLFAQLAPMTDGQIARADGAVTRAEFAEALNIFLFADLLHRVPEGAAYVRDVVGQGGSVVFDHGALRTIAMPQGGTGGLPSGEGAFRRILEPLGYRVAGVYPLPRLHMTGYAFRHLDFPETLPQFFVSELHVDQFDAGFAAACTRVFGSSIDPLDARARDVLARFASGAPVSLDEARAALPIIAGAFDRQHEVPALEDYETLRAYSAEAAWIATEGNAFNHATDRVADVEVLADQQRALGRPMKDQVEISRSGRVRQTAYRAAKVSRSFTGPDGQEVDRLVPGSFFEFISRDRDDAADHLDLTFDSGNATGIFAMTRSNEPEAG